MGTDHFLIVGRDPGAWLELARGQLLSAEALYERLRTLMRSQPPSVRRIESVNLLRSTLLLLGLAVENAAKAAHIARNPGLVTSEGMKKIGGLGGHGVRALVEAVIQINAEEGELLTRLEENVLWGGRYPIPLKGSDYDRRSNRRLTAPSELAIVAGLVDRLEREARRLSKGPEPVP